MADARNVVFLLSCRDRPEDLARLGAAAAALTAGRPSPPPVSLSPPPLLPQAACPPRRALFAPRVRLPLRACVGRAAAEPVGLYPPGVPLAARGERIDEGMAERLARAGVESAVVLAEGF
jgi:lysine decarboxylase